MELNKSQLILVDFAEWLREEYSIEGSGTAPSYLQAMKMVFKYLDIKENSTEIDIDKVKKFYGEIKNKLSKEYKSFLSAFSATSYLEKGWVRSGLKHFFRYYANEPVEKDEINTDTYNLTSTVTKQEKEGKRVEIYTTKYERSSRNRNACVKIHGTKCQICNFDFSKFYGEIGNGFIEVHHIKPLHGLEEEICIDPAKDLIPLCSNCHRMIHRKKDKITQIDELRRLVKTKSGN